MENNKYTRYNLKPIDREEQRLFWKFRVDDIVDLFKYVCCIETIWFLAFITGLLTDVSEKQMGFVILGSVSCTMHWSVYCFRFRLQTHMIPVTMILYTVY